MNKCSYIRVYIYPMRKVKRNISSEKMAKVAMLLKTISHPVRLQILEALEEQEPLDVSSIRGCIDIQVEQSMLSHHLIKMKDKGVLQSFKEGKSVYYSLRDRQVLKIFDCMEKCKL